MFESLSDKLQKAFTGFKSKGHLTEDDINDGIREIRMALLEADVNYKVVKNFTRRVKERCLTAEVMDSLTPGQNVIKIVLDELTELLGGTTAELTFGSRIPGVVMLVGLQAQARRPQRPSSRIASGSKVTTRCWSPATSTVPQPLTNCRPLATRWACASIAVTARIPSRLRRRACAMPSTTCATS